MKTIREILEKITDLSPTVEDSSGNTNDRLTSVLQYAKQQELDQALKEIEEVLLSSLPEEHICTRECNIRSNECEIGHKAYKDAEKNVLEETRKAIKSIIGGK